MTTTFDNAADWLRSLGGVPPERIVFDPLPGTATEADLLRLVERDKRLCELIDGTLVEKPVGHFESIVAAVLITYLNQFVLPRGLGYVTGGDGPMRLRGGRIRLPDVAYFSFDRLPNRRVPADPIPTVTPDLAIEVLSESNTVAEIDQKLREYFQSGTRLAWVIDPRPRTVAVYLSPDAPVRVLNEQDPLDGEHVLLGFTMPVAELFRMAGPRAQTE